MAVERRADGVALVTLDRPKMNALSVAFLGQLRDALAELAADPPGAVVLWGGPRLFAAGADVGEFSEPGAGGAHRRGASTAPRPRWPRCRASPIAAITGYALGGGLELALACDLRVVSDDARLGQPEILLGHHPRRWRHPAPARGWSGLSRAKDLICTGRQVRRRRGAADRPGRPGGAPRSTCSTRRWHWRPASRPGPLAALAAAKRRHRRRRRTAASAAALELEAHRVRLGVRHRGRPCRRDVVPRARPRPGPVRRALRAGGAT